MGDKWNLPPRFDLDVDRLKQIDEQQREWAAKLNSPHLQLTPQEQARARAAQQIPELEQSLKDVDMEAGRSITGTGETDLKALLEARLAISRDLAEAYAEVGRFDLAAKLDTPEMETYLAIWKAVWMDDAIWCEHANLRPTPTYVVRDVYSVRDGKERALLRCSKCGTINVAPLPQSLIDQRRHRQRAKQLAGHLSPEEAKKTLTAAKHTAANLRP